ncbi:MAG: hypothetical protein IJC99_05885, partial [Clostridia bacterium]|nr:hypothetical protein [Clostridia bacterium]
DNELANVSRYVLAVGTSNPLALQAAQVFEQSFFKEGSVSIDERVHKSTEVITLNSDIPIVFAYTRDGNFKLPITNPSIASDYNVAFSTSGYNHLYNKELNGYVGGQEGKLVDYPIVAGIEIGAALTACGNAANFTDGYVYSFIPDNFEVGSFHIEVGLTKYARTKVLAGQEIGYYGYAIKDGKITITAFDDPTLRLAKQLFIDNLADFLVDGVYQIPTDLEYEFYKSEGLTGAVNALYAYETAQGSNNDASTQLGKFSFVVNNLPRPDGINLSGAVDVGDNTLQLYYNDGVGLSNYNEYRDKLVNDNGFTVYMDERKVEGSRYVTLTKVIGSDTITVHLIYDAYAHADDEAVSDANTANKLDLMFTPTLRVIAAKVDNNLVNLLPTKYHKLQTYTKKTDTRITNVQISSDSFGYCYIYTLEDGSFIVLDGGGGGEREGLVSKNSINAGLIYNTLVNLHTELFGAPSTSNKIKIAAWYLSHGHGDHYGTMDTFMSEYVSGSNKKVEVEAIIHNFPSNDEIYNAFDPNPTVRNNYINGSPYKNGSTAIPYYKVHTGQKFFIRNMEFEVLYTHEDIHPWAVEFYNNTSTVIRLTAHYTNGDGKPVAGSQAVSNMILGDLQVRGSQVMRARYGDYLKSDMVQLSHHGGNGVEAELYYNIDAQVIWWTHSADNMKTNTDAYSATAYVKENVAMLNNTRWLYIFTLNPLSKNMTENEYKNLTVKMTKDGFPGLYSRLEGDAPETLDGKQETAQAALLANMYSINTTVTIKNYGLSVSWSHSKTEMNASGIAFGTGNFNGSSYSGNGFLYGRQNYAAALPITYPKNNQPAMSGDDVDDPFTNFEIPEIIW